MSNVLLSDPVDSAPQLRQQKIAHPSFDLLGLRLHAITKYDLVSIVATAIEAQSRCIMANHNLHSFYLWSRTPTMRDFYAAADYINVDGMSLILLGKLLGQPLSAKYRTNYIDLLPLLAEEAARRQWRVFYLGSHPAVADRAAQKLRAEYRGLQIAVHGGYFDMTQLGQENQRVLARIREYDPDVLMVGMGMPRQEIWIGENLGSIDARAIFCCGGLMDLVAGEIPTPPRWLGPLALEWLYRLISQPQRTWRRYLVEPWAVLTCVAREYRTSGRLRIGVRLGDTQ